VSGDERPAGILGRIGAQGPDTSVPASPVDVLLVDADGEFRAGVARLLRRNAHTVVEVGGAEEGIEAVRGGCAPRLLVVGLEPPAAAAREALAALRALGPCAGVALLVLCRTEADVPAGLRPSTTLLKPVEATELVEAVRRLCGSAPT
jgi:DNA-binding NarL/FixJ family response regulator